MTEQGRPTDDLFRTVDDLAAQVAHLTGELREVTATVYAGDLTAQPADVRSPLYEKVDDWVREYFAPTFGRSLGGEFRWCPQWREHAEAITRLEALWRSWETLRLDARLGMANWLGTYLDPQLPVLLGRTGPFAQCSPERHAPAHALPVR
jgi:hypothetical protein